MDFTLSFSTICGCILLFCTSCDNPLVIIDDLQELPQLPNCVGLVQPEYIINDSIAYYNGLQQASENCGITPNLPPIDFAERTLLGKFTETETCQINYKRHVMADPHQQAYIYQISLNKSGNCAGNLLSDMNWISVPKLPQGYTVLFEVTIE